MVGVKAHAPLAEIWSVEGILGDWMLTLDARAHNAPEENVILGHAPSTGAVDRYALGAIAVDIAVVPLLPKSTRNAVWWFVAGFESYLVQHQWHVGYRFSTRF